MTVVGAVQGKYGETYDQLPWTTMDPAGSVDVSTSTVTTPKESGAVGVPSVTGVVPAT